MDNSLPPDQVARILELERRLNNVERQQNPPAPRIFDLDDVTGQASGDSMTMLYDRATGTWQPQYDWAPGDVKWSANPSAVPGRWLLANGAAVSRTTYAALYAAIGTTYGVGDGSTTFNLPNLSARMILGAGTDALASTGGARTHTLTVGEMPAHTHAQVVTAGFTGGTGDRLDYDSDMPSGDAQAYDQGVNTGSAGGGGAHNNMPPYIALWGYVRY